MAKKSVKNKVPSKKFSKYQSGKADGFCPKCGPGIFLGKHKDRKSCGKCGYAIFSN
jgi:ubiquitin-small subunit ribosomal protein S27Ae